MSGETDATTQLISKQFDMLRAGQLKPIAIIAEGDVRGVGAIPSVSGAVPTLSVAPIYFVIFMPADVPQEVSDKVQTTLGDVLANSVALADNAEGRGSIMTVHSGADAQDRIRALIQTNAWLLHDSGQIAVSPMALGIVRP